MLRHAKSPDSRSSGDDDQEQLPPVKIPHPFSGYQKKVKKKHGLAVPATSAPVERVFSHSGIIMHYRARTSAKTLSELIFLKYNYSVVLTL